MAKHYADNKSFRLEMIKSNHQGQITEKAIEIFKSIVDGVQKNYVYDTPSDKEDCKANAVEIFINKWKKFDIKRTNPFSYFTTVALNGIHAGWNEIDKCPSTHSYSSIFEENI